MLFFFDVLIIMIVDKLEKVYFCVIVGIYLVFINLIIVKLEYVCRIMVCEVLWKIVILLCM